MTLASVRNTACVSYFEQINSFLQSKWFVVALAVSSLVFLGAAAFGGTGLFATQLPQWMAHAVGTIGQSGCLSMFLSGTLLGGACIIMTMISALLCVGKSRSVSTTTLDDPIEEIPDHYPVIETIATPPNRESIETLNARLIDAARNGRREEVTALLDQGANIDVTDDTEYRSTPLILAVENAHLGIVTDLLERVASIEARDALHRTALMLAAAIGKVAEINALLEKGADIEASTALGRTPLMYAAALNQPAAALILLEHGADLYATDRGGKTSIHHARGEARNVILNWRIAHPHV